MNGFYNSTLEATATNTKSCHTAPNERLLQLTITAAQYNYWKLSYRSD